MSYPIVLHPDILEFLRENTLHQFPEQVWKCLQKIKQGSFDGGLRVKKLKGISRGVWEARINQSSRIIFTYQNSIESSSDPKGSLNGSKKTYIAIQDICIDHDDVTRSGKRARKTFADTQWLETDVVKEIGNLYQDRSSLSQSQQQQLDNAQLQDLEELENITRDIDELLSNIQWRVVDTQKQWEQAILSKDKDLPLKLSLEEYELVILGQKNTLLSGSAGTGKTTIGLYKLIKSLEYLPTDKKRLYVAYNSFLVKEAEKQFKRLINRDISDIDSCFDFKTVRQLCIEILNSSEQIYMPYDEVNYQYFKKIYDRMPRKHKHSSILVWNEIRGIIKGSQLSTDIKLLSKEEYQDLGGKRSQFFSQHDRSEIYDYYASLYQRKLQENQRFDEIDLAREVIKLIQQGKSNPYELIVCDEVQDFTELQLKMLIDLSTSNSHLFFAGDINQIISPSGFRWEDLRSIFFHNNQESVLKSLSYNFRSVGCLRNLANQLLKLKSSLLKEHSDHKFDSSTVDNSLYGDYARLINSSIDKLQPAIKKLYPDDAILVRTDVDKIKLSEQFKSSLVFTIEEAKGLEFDTVFLVEFFENKQELWKAALSGVNKPEFKIEINLLYVAITRARRILNIWEESKTFSIWNRPEIAVLLQSVIPNDVRKDQSEPTPKMWRERGVYYKESGFYYQALECFKESGDINLYKGVEAEILLEDNEYKKAAEIFIELTNWERAAQIFERIKEWNLASDAWRNSGNSEKQVYCQNLALKEKTQATKNNQKAEKNVQSSNFDPQKPKEVSATKSSDMSSKFEQYLNKGKEKYKQKNYKAAIIEYNKAINLNPNGFTAYTARGNAQLEMGNKKGAIDDYTKAININPNDTETYYYRGNAYKQIGQKQKAIDDYTQALKLNPNDANGYYKRGATRVNLGDNKGAIDDYTQAIKLDTNDANAYYNRGAARVNLGDNQGAIDDYNQALKLDPNHANAYHNRGVSRYKLGDNQGAINDYNQALKLDPNHASAYHNRGVSRYKLGDNQGAIDDYNQALKLNPNYANTYHNRGVSRYKLGDNQRAIDDYNQALKLDPNYANAYYNRGTARGT
jgi:tetratricopeptide (TPR) repeat protein/Txe/YoeB family toxin of Txe-Axe toxin-antitoxin module